MNEGQKNDYYDRVERAVRFVENNLKNKLSVDLIAEKACFSKYHFMRMFSAMTGETVGDYVRRRRISRSSRDLLATKRTILSIAMDYQFESQEAYTRSFKSVYHMTPGAYRKYGINQIAFGRSKLSVNRLKHLKKNITMEPEILEVPEKKLIGMKIKTSLADNRIPELWTTFMARTHEINNDRKTGYYEIHPYDSDFDLRDFSESLEFEKWAALEVTDFEHVPKGMKTHVLPKGKYAKFIHRGPMSNVQLSFDFVYGTWLPNSNYTLDLRDDFERYDEHEYFGPNHPDSQMEIYIPVK